MWDVLQIKGKLLQGMRSNANLHVLMQLKQRTYWVLSTLI